MVEASLSGWFMRRRRGTSVSATVSARKSHTVLRDTRMGALFSADGRWLTSRAGIPESRRSVPCA
jgi:hypothetical protein